MLRWMGHVAHIGENRNAYKFSERKLENERKREIR
jgi:hypothetical protein